MNPPAPVTSIRVRDSSIPRGYRGPMLLLIALSCGFDASGSLVDSGLDDPTPVLSDSDEPVVEDSDEPVDPDLTDDDGDGYTENAGDCDDADSAVNPGAEDACNGVDDDCDSDVDEDAVDDDPYEPNDEVAAQLGALEDQDTHEIAAFLHNDADDDVFSFYVDDSWTGDEFPVTITLSNIPSDATYKLGVERVESDGDGELGVIDEEFGTGTLTIVLEDSSGPEDGGVYEVTVGAIANADCGKAYLLTIIGD
ncbi:MAG: hypothetical protein GY913_11870 [Proteobacteria bacterium]|nr:hypothetical protein [Pseudomonadota bacterium]MCP4917612.1 hypothetical protein [Pseudomonadota bacterium]